MLDESEYERDDDAAPIDMLESYFAAHGWSHTREEDEVVAKVKGSWTEYELRAIWRDTTGSAHRRAPMTTHPTFIGWRRFPESASDRCRPRICGLRAT